MASPKTKQEIAGVYEELKGILATTPDHWFDDEGFAAHANRVIERVGATCPDIQDIEGYKIERDHLRDGRIIIQAPQARAKLAALIGRLKGTYALESPASQDRGGHTFIQNQSQTQSLGVVLEWQEKIIQEIPKHAEGTKERTFLEKLKASLPTIKSVTDILSSALKLGAELGLSPATIQKLLGI